MGRSLRTRFHFTQVRFSVKMLFQLLPLIILIKKYLVMAILLFSVCSFRPLFLIISSSEHYLLYIYCYSEAIYKLWSHPSLIFTLIDYIHFAPSTSPLIIFFSNSFIFFATLCISLVLHCLPKWCHSFADKIYFLPMTEENEQRKGIF